MKTARCPSCEEKVDRRRDRPLLPFCSIVCRTLGRAGLGWRLYPYRIVDLQSGTVLTTGPAFDLTARGLAELQKKAERLRQPAYEKPAIAPEPALLSSIPDPCLNPPASSAGVPAWKL